MFSTREYLDKKTGPYGIPRDRYISLLVDEYKSSSSLTAKQEVLANLANFAYDPINFEYLQDFRVFDIFLKVLENPEDEQLLEYAISGICNLSAHPSTKDYFIKNNAIGLLQKHLGSDQEDIVVTSITTLIYMIPQDYMSMPPGLVATMLRFVNSQKTRVSNVAKLFLADCCTKAQIESATREQQQWNKQVAAN